MSSSGHWYDCDLDVHLETVIDAYEQARQERCASRLDEEEWSLVQQLRTDADRIAAAIRGRAFALRNVASDSELNDIYQSYRHERDEAEADFKKFTDLIRRTLPKEEAERLISSVGSLWDADPDPEEIESNRPLRLVWERLCIEDAIDAIAQQRPRVRRILKLERLIDQELGRDQPPEPCAQFLALVSRSYIHGFVPECVVMCRSAMETAFREAILPEHCKRVSRGENLAGRIHAAFAPENALLADEPSLYRAAQEVKERGDKVVHYEAEGVKDALGTIRSALRVIKALSRLRGL